MDYVNGDNITNNKHLAEAIDMTREGSMPADGTSGYDEPGGAGPDYTLRNSTFHVAIDELEKITTAPKDSQEEIKQVIAMLREARGADDHRRSQVMTEAHSILQDVWVPPE